MLKVSPSSSILIASDIDRTLLSPPLTFKEEELSLLHYLQGKGVVLFFVTGRSEMAAKTILAPLDFPYYLAAQNGTTLIAEPTGQILKLHHIDLDDLGKLWHRFVLIGNKVSFYRSDGFTSEEEAYLLERAIKLNEECLSSPPTTPIFSLKRFGYREELEKEIQPFLEKGYTVTLTRDVLVPAMTVAQITPPGVNKGRALDDLINYLETKPETIIGCGDDHNDIPLLQRAHFRIVMEDAPKQVLELADHITEDALKGGLFTAFRKIFML